MNIYSRKAVNTQRQFEFDLCKALAIIYMVTVHVYEMLYKTYIMELPYTEWEYILSFAAGPLAAPIFMFSLGVGIIYSKHKEPKSLFLRGLRLFIIAYILNIARFCIPYLIYSLPRSEFDVSLFWYTLLDVDILQFAGLTFMFTALLKKFVKNVNLFVLIALILQIFGIILDYYCNQFVSAPLSYVLGLMFYTGPGSYFPFLVWYIYPTLGIFFANILIHIKDLDNFYLRIFIVVSVLLTAFCCTLHFAGYDIRNFYLLRDEIYYRQTFLHVVFTTSVILIALSIAHFLHKWVHFKKADKIISTMSTNLNVIFIIQWLIIGPLCYGFQVNLVFNGWLIIPISLAIIIVGVVLSILYKQLIKKIKEYRKIKIST